MEFRVENGPFPFITQCYIWALSNCTVKNKLWISLDNTTYLPRIIAGVISNFIHLEEGIYSLLHNYSESLYIPAFN